jgi:glutathione synthase/RimK-type ligase-like ATP-grasp enzyme
MILLLTHSGDHYTIDRVCGHLAEMGSDFFRVNTDLMPVQYPLSAEFSSAYPGRLSLYLEDKIVDLSPEKITSVWARRIWPARFPDECPPELVHQCHPAASALVMESLGLMDGVYWMNPLAEGKRAESKLLQLSIANRVGMPVPETLVTNHPEKIRDFFQAHNGQIITKLLVPQVQSMEAHPNFSYTCKVAEEHLEHLDQVRGMPQIFQPFLPKVREYRVVVLAGKFFTGALQIPVAGPLSVDWRQATEEDELNWEEAELPGELQHLALQMLEELGLVFGVFDFAETPDGEFYFFEVNQAGEWGMLEHYLDLPISKAIAEELSA